MEHGGVSTEGTRRQLEPGLGKKGESLKTKKHNRHLRTEGEGKEGGGEEGEKREKEEEKRPSR